MATQEGENIEHEVSTETVTDPSSTPSLPNAEVPQELRNQSVPFQGLMETPQSKVNQHSEANLPEPLAEIDLKTAKQLTKLQQTGGLQLEALAGGDILVSYKGIPLWTEGTNVADKNLLAEQVVKRYKEHPISIIANSKSLDDKRNAISSIVSGKVGSLPALLELTKTDPSAGLVIQALGKVSDGFKQAFVKAGLENPFIENRNKAGSFLFTYFNHEMIIDELPLLQQQMGSPEFGRELVGFTKSTVEKLRGVIGDNPENEKSRRLLNGDLGTITNSFKKLSLEGQKGFIPAIVISDAASILPKELAIDLIKVAIQSEYTLESGLAGMLLESARNISADFGREIAISTIESHFEGPFDSIAHSAFRELIALEIADESATSEEFISFFSSIIRSDSQEIDLDVLSNAIPLIPENLREESIRSLMTRNSESQGLESMVFAEALIASLESVSPELKSQLLRDMVFGEGAEGEVASQAVQTKALASLSSSSNPLDQRMVEDYISNLSLDKISVLLETASSFPHVKDSTNLQLTHLAIINVSERETPNGELDALQLAVKNIPHTPEALHLAEKQSKTPNSEVQKQNALILRQQLGRQGALQKMGELYREGDRELQQAIYEAASEKLINIREKQERSNMLEQHGIYPVEHTQQSK